MELPAGLVSGAFFSLWRVLCQLCSRIAVIVLPVSCCVCCVCLRVLWHVVVSEHSCCIAPFRVL